VSPLSSGITVLLAATLLLSSCSSAGHESAAPATHSDQPVVTGEPAGDNAADITFADAVIAQNGQEIELAKLVADHSSNSKVVALAASRTSTRQSEMSILKVLVVQWNSNQENQDGQRNATATKGPLDQAAIAKLQSSQGSAFDKLWLQSMIGLDEGSIAVANAEVAGGKNVDAVDVAKQIVAARPADIDQMKSLLGT
jgi:uncharacterized protein (DUF305 family)